MDDDRSPAELDAADDADRYMDEQADDARERRREERQLSFEWRV